MPELRILIILGSLEGGGAERVSVIIANSFVEAGYRVTLLLGTKKGVYFDLLDKRILVSELKAKTFAGYCRRLFGYLAREKYSHIFTASDYISAATVLVCKTLRLKSRVIATLHYNLFVNLANIPAAQRNVFRLLNRHLIARADQIIAVSNGVMEGFLKVTGSKVASRVKVIYNPAFDDKIYLKAKEPVDSDLFVAGTRTIITVGRLDANKNQTLLVGAFDKLSKRFADLRLLIIGDGSLKGRLEKLVRQYGLESKTRLTGFRNNPFAYMARSDVFVLSSLTEGLPTVLVEALALGVNVVSTDCPSGPAEILDQGTYGRLATNNDEASLVLQIEAALNNPIRPELLRQRADFFHSDKIMSHYFDVVKNI